MPHPIQRVNSIYINRLKGLSRLDLDFGDKPLTAIMGVNGCGKTTILHALACCYQPYAGHSSHNYIFSEFFTPSTDSTWGGSRFMLFYNHALAHPLYLTERLYRKDNDRWSPRYKTRLQRWVSYIGIKESVPVIEQLKTRSHIGLVRTNKSDALSNSVRIAASHVLNRNYTLYTTNQRAQKVFIGVQHNGTHYSAISMGSGEQRVFKILEEVYKAPDYGLILIDEIELLMHSEALKRLIIKLNEIANEKYLQIIFTTHSEIVLGFKDQINIRHIFIAEDNNAYSLKDSNPKLLYELTGVQQKPLSIFVEDDLSKEIVMKVAGQLGVRQHLRLDVFGPAINCFTTAAGAVLNGVKTENALFVMDGDLYTTDANKKERIRNVLTGTDYASRKKQVLALKSISQFNLPIGFKPEQYFHSQIIGINPAGLNDEEREIRDAAVHIQGVDDAHKYIDDIVSRLGYPKNDYRAIVGFLSTLPFWTVYVQPIYDWLHAKKTELHL